MPWCLGEAMRSMRSFSPQGFPELSGGHPHSGERLRAAAGQSGSLGQTSADACPSLMSRWRSFSWPTAWRRSRHSRLWAEPSGHTLEAESGSRLNSSFGFGSCSPVHLWISGFVLYEGCSDRTPDLEHFLVSFPCSLYAVRHPVKN